MSYTIYKTNGMQLMTLLDGTIDDKYAVKLVGKNYINYGTAQNENFVYLMENFANDTAPLFPLTGQLWYNTSSNTLSYFDGVSYNGLASTASLGAGTAALEAKLVANVVALNAAITANAASATANAAVQAGQITSLWANAAVQDTSIVGLTAGLTGSNVRISTLETTTTLHTAQIAGLQGADALANIRLYNLEVDTSDLWANAVVQAQQIAAISGTGYITSSALTPYAPLESANLTGYPSAPTPAIDNDGTQIATTGFVRARETLTRAYVDTTVSTNITNTNNVLNAAINLRATINSPAFTGTVTAPTVSVSDTSTKVATTAYVKAATQYWDGSRKFVSTSSPSSGDGSDGDFWFQYQ
jgi:hypothetical protein